jgi:hypothetical protein
MMVEFEWTPNDYEGIEGERLTNHTLRFSASHKDLIAVTLIVSDRTLWMSPPITTLYTEEDVAAFRDIVNQALLAYIDILAHQQSGVSVLVALEQIQAQYRAYRAQEN